MKCTQYANEAKCTLLKCILHCTCSAPAVYCSAWKCNAVYAKVECSVLKCNAVYLSASSTPKIQNNQTLVQVHSDTLVHFSRLHHGSVDIKFTILCKVGNQPGMYKNTKLLELHSCKILLI